jgi:hypothetical protein
VAVRVLGWEGLDADTKTQMYVCRFKDQTCRACSVSVASGKRLVKQRGG